MDVSVFVSPKQIAVGLQRIRDADLNATSDPKGSPTSIGRLQRNDEVIDAFDLALNLLT